MPAITNQVWKYLLPYTGPAKTIEIEMPAFALQLAVQPQDGDVALWAQVNPSAAMKTRYFTLVMTGESMEAYPGKYLGTVQFFPSSGPFVLHVYELPMPLVQ